ncbi:MAG: peptidase M4 [Methanosarcina sp.]
MANNKNIVIGLLLLVIIVLLAIIAFRPMMYGSTYGPGSNMPWNMGPGMMGNRDGNYSPGPGMMGGMGDMMALYYPEARPIGEDEARQNIENFASQYGSNVEVEDFMTFSGNYYAIVKDTGTNKNIAEILVDRYSGSAYPEPGPNMMWNTQFGAGRSRSGGAEHDITEAENLAGDFLAGYLPRAKILESKEMPGYYTFDFGRQDIEGMLSVNAYTGQIWVHTWHGPYLGGMNMTS